MTQQELEKYLEDFEYTEVHDSGKVSRWGLSEKQIAPLAKKLIRDFVISKK